METFDDVDEEEAFISELMALHPNDDDIVVEDLEIFDEPVAPVEDEDETLLDVQDAVEEIVVRQSLVNGFPSIALSCGSNPFGRSSLSPLSARQLILCSYTIFLLLFLLICALFLFTCTHVNQNYSQMKLASTPTIPTLTICRWLPSSLH